jgi:hypothetical protein
LRKVFFVLGDCDDFLDSFSGGFPFERVLVFDLWEFEGDVVCDKDSVLEMFVPERSSSTRV